MPAGVHVRGLLWEQGHWLVLDGTGAFYKVDLPEVRVDVQTFKEQCVGLHGHVLGLKQGKPLSLSLTAACLQAIKPHLPCDLSCAHLDHPLPHAGWLTQQRCQSDQAAAVPCGWGDGPHHLACGPCGNDSRAGWQVGWNAISMSFAYAGIVDAKFLCPKTL
eukprot:scaffold19570_cov18-Tisochrysis_lutea.AAC.1